jgi:hypothetical protein
MQSKTVRLIRVFSKNCALIWTPSPKQTEVRWLSKRNMLGRLYELREELSVFLIEKGMTDLLEQFYNPKFEIRLAYLVDIFRHLNKLICNYKIQAIQNGMICSNMFVVEDKLRAFICKLELWIRKIEATNYLAFPLLKTFIDEKNYSHITAEVQQNVIHTCTSSPRTLKGVKVLSGMQRCRNENVRISH